MLLHKTFFLRGLWQNDTLSFDSTGRFTGHSAVVTPLACGG